MRTGALLEEPMASMAATVLAGMGDSERVKGERLDSSHPDNSPPAGANNERARSRFANGPNCIDRSPANRLELPKKQTTLHPVSLCKSYRNLDLTATILKARSWPNEVAMQANTRKETNFEAAWSGFLPPRKE